MVKVVAIVKTHWEFIVNISKANISTKYTCMMHVTTQNKLQRSKKVRKNCGALVTCSKDCSRLFEGHVASIHNLRSAARHNSRLAGNRFIRTHDFCWLWV